MRVKAKRFGWDEEDDDPDRTPMSELYDSMDLEGELEVVEYDVPAYSGMQRTKGKVYLVDGQEADLKTIEELK